MEQPARDPNEDPAYLEASHRAAEKFSNSLTGSCRAVPPSELLQDTDKLKGKVVLVTGAGSGIGYAFCTFAATLGSILVLVDFNEDSIKTLKREIDESNVSGEAHITPRTSVSDWNGLRSVFEWADQKFGRIDSVIACAGVTEDQNPSYDAEVLDKDGKLQAPSLRTLDVNLIGTIYTLKLARYYMRKRKVKGSVVLLGSLSSFFGLPLGPMYTTSKHGVYGLTRSVAYSAAPDGININMVAPWFVKTPILNVPVKLLLAGLPYTKMPDVVNAITYAATCRDLAGAALPVDPKGVFIVPHDTSNFGQGGFNAVFGQRTATVIARTAVIRDYVEILGGAVVGPATVLAGLSAVVAYFAWQQYSA
ncbi:NAD(P)-binding protein [Cystobasidium minutum MCA 4210]|uniref:NAD(P)-binding protein n=1 Tax=Cystobasidium minutum MCA 4210 TaxID=1397322 RepID=UPI0034CE241E|eukprot:jgi/Rhomi1/210195/estExt_Genemark1.C_3_t20421